MVASDAGTCTNCGYSLAGLPTPIVCPECGRAQQGLPPSASWVPALWRGYRTTFALGLISCLAAWAFAETRRPGRRRGHFDDWDITTDALVLHAGIVLLAVFLSGLVWSVVARPWNQPRGLKAIYLVAILALVSLIFIPALIS